MRSNAILLQSSESANPCKMQYKGETLVATEDYYLGRTFDARRDEDTFHV